MYNISNSIETIGAIVADLSMDAEKVSGFRAQYEKIALRNRNPYFYLSMIGDFSSGKSTLINTLIRQKLLKVAHAATTAVPTYIYEGKRDDVVLHVRCDDGKRYDLTTSADLHTFEKKFKAELPQKIDEQISLLTADKTLSSKIREVSVELPHGTLASGLCIIDTPGINPGADYAKNHAEITKNILNEKADAIVILFPADQAYTQSFEAFLKDNAAYFMKDAIFVVTMMDRIDEEERDDVVRFVKANLRTSFHLDDPQVMFCSAMQVGRDPYWTEQFRGFERSLMERLAENRQRIIAERLFQLSNALLHSIQDEVSLQRTAFEERLTVLQSHSVPNLRSLLTDIQRNALDTMKKTREKHDAVMASQSAALADTIRRTVDSGLSKCSTRSEVTKYVKESLASDIEYVCREIYSASNMYIGMLNNEHSNAAAKMVKKLETYYGEIGSTLPELASLSPSDKPLVIADKLSDVGGIIGNYEGKIDLATAIGGAGLAAIILTGLGPVGWIIGGAAALIGGDRMFVESSRGKVREAVFSKVGDITEAIRSHLCSEMQKRFTEAEESLEEKKRTLISQYQPDYEKLQKQFQAEKLALTLQLQQSEHMQSRIKNVLQQIKTRQGETTA